MKSRAATYLCVVLLTIGAVFSLLMARDSSGQQLKQLQLELQADKESYLPGEVITLNFKLRNNSTETVALRKSMDVGIGNLRVFITDESGAYKEYKGPRWGLLDGMGGGVKIAPGATMEAKATVLHNHVISTAHLNPLYAEQIAKSYVMTSYALPQSGTFYLKAVLNDVQRYNSIESAPLRINIESPQGDDLEVWKQLKDKADIALFMQTGEVSGRADGMKAAEIETLLRKIETEYPNSRYIESLRAGLTKHRALMEKINRKPSHE